MRFVLLCAFLSVCLLLARRGASLFGKVIEVNSGDVITIFNLNRPVRVRLLGVDAPEMDQAFGDVAKKHLADLVYDKSVLVEYAGIAADSSLNGRVLLERRRHRRADDSRRCGVVRSEQSESFERDGSRRLSAV